MKVSQSREWMWHAAFPFILLFADHAAHRHRPRRAERLARLTTQGGHMSINPTVPNFMIPQVDPPLKARDCEALGERHDMPDDWDYTHDPAGSMTCRRCGVTWHD